MHTTEKGRAHRFRVIVVGGGGTGAAILHDLSLRGFDTVLVERGELTSGTTGRHHGQLHSGARYAVNDKESAVECVEENAILRRIARPALELNDGLFVAVSDEDEAFSGRFLESCRACGISTRLLAAEEALALEPNLTPGVRLAVQVPDGTMDAWRLPMMFYSTARSQGADIRTFTEVLGLESAAGGVTGVRVVDRRAEREYTIKGDLVVNAAGPWAGQIARMSGNHSKAQEYYQKSILNNPSIETDWFTTSGIGVGYSFLKAGNTSEANKLLNPSLDLRLRHIEEGDANFETRYFLAAIYAIRNDKKESYKWLQKAIDAGWMESKLALRDPWLENLHQDEQFKQMISQVEHKIDQMRQNADGKGW